MEARIRFKRATFLPSRPVGNFRIDISTDPGRRSVLGRKLSVVQANWPCEGGKRHSSSGGFCQRPVGITDVISDRNSDSWCCEQETLGLDNATICSGGGGSGVNDMKVHVPAI